MSDYISREALREAFDNADADVCESYPDGHCDWGFGRKTVNEVIAGIPAADVEPVRHGRWEHKKNDYSVAWCSECKGLFDTTWHGKTAKEYFAQFVEAYRYCPRCGGKMDLEDENNDD